MMMILRNTDWDKGDEIRVVIEVLEGCMCVLWDEKRDFVSSFCKAIGELQKRCDVFICKPWEHCYVQRR